MVVLKTVELVSRHRNTGIDDETLMLVETTADGAIVLRLAAVYPLEQYSEARLREFETTNQLPEGLEERLRNRASNENR